MSVVPRASDGEKQSASGYGALSRIDEQILNDLILMKIQQLTLGNLRDLGEIKHCSLETMLKLNVLDFRNFFP